VNSDGPKSPLDPRLLSYARRMRAEATDAEKRLWQRLRNRQLDGYKFRRQATVGGYILDFYCPAAKLAIELDGGQHAEEHAVGYDAGRTSALGRLGITVLRFWDHDVLRDTDAVLRTIHRALSGNCVDQPPSSG
jgi:very-short-patch-repair endonuclease